MAAPMRSARSDTPISSTNGTIRAAIGTAPASESREASAVRAYESLADKARGMCGGGEPVSVILGWQDNAPNEDGTTIERAVGTNGPFQVIANLAATAADRSGTGARTWTDTSVADATTYRYRVRAYNASGPSAYSNIATVTTLPPPPNTPGSLEAETPPAYTPPTPTVTLQAGQSLTVVASADAEGPSG